MIDYDIEQAGIVFGRADVHCTWFFSPSATCSDDLRWSTKSTTRSFGNSAIAFPQNACSVLAGLPLRAADLAEYLSVFFTDANQSDLHLCKEFVVRRPAVHQALRWLVVHDPYYADLQIDLAALEELPVHVGPTAWLQQARTSDTPLTRNISLIHASLTATLRMI